MASPRSITDHGPQSRGHPVNHPTSMTRRFLTLALASVACATLPAAPATLKEAFAEHFLVGAALNSAIITEADHPARALVTRHFGSVTAANAMKWGPFNPEPGVYVYEPADALVAFAEANGMQVIGHTLFWHQQTPRWVFQDATGGEISREALLQRMRERVQLLAKRYGTRVHLWDVVNEAVEDDGSPRKSPWYRILGDDFVPEAFRIAGEELPASVQLIYNDYSMFMPGRRDAVVKMIHDLRARGLRIDGVGMQGHWGLDFPKIEQAEAAIVAFAAAGVRVHITELDVDVLPRSPDMFGADLNKRAKRTVENDPFTGGLPPEMQEKLARRYAEIFALFVKHADKIDRVTFWGVTDADSWLNFFPVPGRTNHPLLFDRDNKPKPAFDAVMKVGSTK
jgi:endo-1,4-beta-xylanase